MQDYNDPAYKIARKIKNKYPAKDITIMVETEAAYEMSRQIVKKEGIFVGMSSGAAMYATVEMAKQITSGTIVVILPDRGEKYLSTKLF